MAATHYLAVDLGASSGRLVAGKLRDGRVQLEEIHRFPNGGILVGETLHWDVLALWQQIQEGMRAARDRLGTDIQSIGVDTWGVDFALLGRHGVLLGNPVHYRDRRTAGILERAFLRVPREEIFAATGLQFLEFNSLFQLLAMREQNSAILEQAERLLMMPDLFHWMLTGDKVNEYTNATTTQCFDPQRGTWADSLLERFDLPADLFRPVASPGTSLGTLRSAVAQETGLHETQVTLPGTHDTASAVLAVPAASNPDAPPDWCYISSGTWSLMGVEVAQPVVSERCRELNFTNEGGVGGTIRLLKNIAGLWLVQECRRIWKREGREYDWSALISLAEASDPHRSLVDPDDSRFLAPDEMPSAIRDACRDSGQPVPESDGAVIRCALESLALRYRSVLDWLEELVGHRLEKVHIVGGGVRNRLLCQMAADACNRPVIAGPDEATALGNVLMQAVAHRDLASIAEARRVVQASFELDEYGPRNPDAWDEAYARFRGLWL